MRGKTIFSVIFSIAIMAGFFPETGAAASLSPALKVVYPAFRWQEGAEIRAGGAPGRVVLVAVDYLQIKDLQGSLPPNLYRLASGGAVALMNPNTGGSVTPENTYATIGSGSHMVAWSSSSRGFGASDRLPGGTASDEYRQRTGRTPPEGSLVYLDIARLAMINKELRHSVTPGALGKQLHGAGLRTAALGNSDGPEGPKRQIISMVMDDLGIVDAGSVGDDVIRRDKDFPGGFITDYAALLQKFAGLPPDIRVVAVDTGDLGRLQDVREQVAPEIWQFWRTKAISRLDGFLGGLMGLINPEKDLLVLVSPTPGDDGEQKDRMSPVIMYGGGAGGGLLASPTTRRPGIIMNIDIAPTVVNFLGIPGDDLFTGRPARVVPGAFDFTALAAMHTVLNNTYQARPVLQKGYVLFQLVLLAVSLGFIFLKKEGKEFLKPFFLAVMGVPLAYLLMPFFPPGGIPALSAEFLIITAALTLVVIFLHKWRGVDPFLLICLATAAVISIDLTVGSPLQKASVMGYDPIVGARFYGLGNEYMGVLIGSAIIGTTALISVAERRRRLYIAASGAVYVVVTILIAAPQLGTNVGGTIAAASAFLVVFLMVSGVRFTWPVVLMVGAAVVLVVLAIILYDAMRPGGSQSHIGRTAWLVAGGGLDRVAEIIARKSEMNIRLIRYTIWSRVLLASLGILALLFYRPVGVMEKIRNRSPYLFRGFVGVVTGSIVAFIFNDSGVVAAATAMVFAAPPLIYLVLDQMDY